MSFHQLVSSKIHRNQEKKKKEKKKNKRLAEAVTKSSHHLHNPSKGTLLKNIPSLEFYIDNGSSILRFFFRASLICFVILMHINSRNVKHIKIKASLRWLK